MTTPTDNPSAAGVTQADNVKTLREMLAVRQKQLASCERMLELLQPEWDKFEAQTGHNTYVARDYADHTSAARGHRKEIAALEYALSHQASIAQHEGGRGEREQERLAYIQGYQEAREDCDTAGDYQAAEEGWQQYAESHPLAPAHETASDDPQATLCGTDDRQDAVVAKLLADGMTVQGYDGEPNSFIPNQLSQSAAQFITQQAEEVTRLREALKKIASCESHHPGDVVDIARAALNEQPGEG